MKKMRLCSQINLHGSVGDDVNKFVRDGLEFHKKMGFDAADFPFHRLINCEDLNLVIEKALATSDELGIRFELSHLPFSKKVRTDPDFLPVFNKNMYRAIDAAKLLGVDYAVVHPNTTTLLMEDYDEAREREIVLSHLSPFVEYANKVGVSLVVENMRLVPKPTPAHRYCQTPEELCDIADTLGVGICWDFGHANIGDLKQSEALAYVGSRLKMLHVNDNCGKDDDHLPPFLGKVDWRDAMHGLALAGYEGLFNYELHTVTVPENMRTAFAEYITRAACELESYIV